jgi:multicomponent Na+:H+ antiporter subunit E
MSEPDAGGNVAVRVVLTFVMSFLLWMLLVGSLYPQEIGAGLVVALLVAIISYRRLSILDGLLLSPLAPVHMLRYLGYFVITLIRANLDMARRVISPRLPINPCMVEVRTQLRSDLGRMLLANSITLTPGTLSVRVQEDYLLVHWIDSPPGIDIDAATRQIAEGFERHIRGFLK